MLEFERYEWLSFDCYGTLVDWETGIAQAIGGALESHDIHLSRSEILALFAEVEPRIQTGGGYLEYRRVRRRVMAMIGIELDFQVTEPDLNAVVTAQQARSYKPSLRNFEMARERMGVDMDRWLHIGESLYHDVGPANRLGLASVWVNRGHDREGAGATRPTDARPDLTVPDLATLVETMGL